MTDFIFDHYRYSGDSSSAIEVAYYDSNLMRLLLKFHGGGVAAYDGVSYPKWEAYETTDSVGRFYNTDIVGRFPGADANYDYFISRENLAPSASVQSAESRYAATIVVKATSYESLLAAVLSMGVSEDDVVKVEKV